jgi:glucokinase
MRAGVDLGGTKIDVLIVEGEREIHGRARGPTPTQGGAAAVVAGIARTVGDAADSAAVRVDQLTGVGVGSPGAVDTTAGTVGFNSNLAGGWTDPYPFAEELVRHVGTRVRVANDVAVAAGAELELGAGRDLSSFLAVWWGTGLGGCVVLSGRRWEGNGGRLIWVILESRTETLPKHGPKRLHAEERVHDLSWLLP